MAKTTIGAQIDRALLAEAQRLLDAGEFRNLNELVEAALREFIENFDAASPLSRVASLRDAGDAVAHTGLPQESLEARQIKGMMADLDEKERAEFDKFVEAYTPVAGQPPSDEDIVHLLAIFRTYATRKILAALHDAQSSHVPLSPHYLETILEKSEPKTVEREGRKVGTITGVNGKPPRTYTDFDNPLAAEVASLYEKEIGELTEKVKEQLTLYVVEFPDLQRWHEAFEAAATMNKRNWRYVMGCLRNTGAQKFEQKGKARRGISKSEQYRTEKRKRNHDYDRYWDDKLKAKQTPRATK
jgi:hypothetical protein